MGIADNLKKRGDAAAETARRTAEEARRAVRGVLAYRERPLSETEISLANKVFGKLFPTVLSIFLTLWVCRNGLTLFRIR